MEIKILQVFYDENGLPYKDQARKVHFPIVGSGFQGASNTTQIKFYFGTLGDTGTSWVATAKLPNGKVGAKVLTVAHDPILNEPYALLVLNSFYFQHKGDVFISLQGYQGGVQVEYDSESELYTITGTPTIQATGSIKLSVNYSTQFVGSGEEEEITMQELLAALGEKLSKDYTPNILYGTNGGGAQTIVPYRSSPTGNSVPIRDTNGQVYTSLPTTSMSAVNLDYLTSNYAYLKSHISVVDNKLVFESNSLTYAVSPLSTADYTIATRDWVEEVVLSAISGLYQPKGSASVSELNSMSKTQSMDGWVYNMTDSGLLNNHDNSTLEVHQGDNVVLLWHSGNWEWDDLTGIVDLSNYYTKTETNTLLGGKQNTLVSGTNIKTINNQSILGSGNINIQGGGDSVTPNETLVGGETKLYSLTIDDTTYDLDNGYEKLTNKVTSLSSSSTDTQYPSAKVVYDNLQNVREVAEGKCKTYILDYSLTFSAIRGISGSIYTVYSFDGTEWVDVSNEVKNNDPTITGLTIKNSVFNSQDDYVSTTNLAENCIIFGKNVASGSVFFLVQCNKLDDLMKTGDIILVVQTEVPDRWCSSDTTYYKLETSKVDLTNYVTTNTDQTITGVKTFSENIYASKKIVGDGNGFDFTTTNYNVSQTHIRPRISDYHELGSSYFKWKNGYFSGQVYAQNTFNVINASDITNNTLTQAQYDLITNGKPTLISGTYWGYNNPILLSLESSGAVRRGFFIGGNNIGMFYLNTSSYGFDVASSTSRFGYLRSVYAINGKEFPTYPSSPTVPQAFIYDTDNSLKYVDTHKEWYGTQAQYDALSTYDSNTLYYIEEE